MVATVVTGLMEAWGYMRRSGAILRRHYHLRERVPSPGGVVAL